jgi:hypothetical protein
MNYIKESKMKLINTSWTRLPGIVESDETAKVKDAFFNAITPGQFSFVYDLMYDSFYKPKQTQEGVIFVLDSYNAAYFSNEDLTPEQEKELIAYLLNELGADYRRFYLQWVVSNGGAS